MGIVATFLEEGKQSPDDVALPHPQPRKDHDGNEDVAGWRRILRNFIERTVNVAEDRDAEDQVNPAEDGAGEASADDGSCVYGCCHGVAPYILLFIYFSTCTLSASVESHPFAKNAKVCGTPNPLCNLRQIAWVLRAANGAALRMTIQEVQTS